MHEHTLKIGNNTFLVTKGLMANIKKMFTTGQNVEIEFYQDDKFVKNVVNRDSSHKLFS